MQVILHATTWMNLKDFMQSEGCLNQKNHTVWFHMYEHRSLVTGNITAVAWAGCWEEKLTTQGLEGTFLADGGRLFFFFILIETVVTWWYNLSRAINLKMCAFHLCKLEFSKVDFTKTNPWWSESHIPQTCLRGLFLSDEMLGGIIELLVAWSPEHCALTMPSPPPCQAAVTWSAQSSVLWLRNTNPEVRDPGSCSSCVTYELCNLRMNPGLYNTV